MDKQKLSDSKSYGLAADKINEVLQGFSKNQASDILRMVGALYNLKVVSAFAPVGPIQSPAPSRDTRGVTRPRVKPVADSRTKELRSEISSLNSQISEKSRSIGRQLYEDDELIIRRGQLFRDIKNAQNKASHTISDGYEKST
jgi:hypothetical protein